MRKATGFPQGRNANVVVVEVVVVDIQADRGEAPNNDEWTCTDAHLFHQSQKQHIHLSPPLVLYSETGAFKPFLTRHRHEVLS